MTSTTETIVCPRTGDALTHIRHASGLDIWVWPQPAACAAYGVFAARYGSVYNTLPAADGGTQEVPAGIAHYLEHKLFEGEDGNADARFAETGADANAYTSFDRTAYLFQATENILPSLEILLDFVRHPYFTPETVQKEQGIIGQEIRMCEDNPSERVLYNMLRGMYARHPVRIDIAGTVESIADITADLLYRCYAQYYHLQNMVLVVAGRITAEQVAATADRYLEPAPPMPEVRFCVEEPTEVCETRVEHTMPVSAPLFCLGFKEPPAACTPARAAGVRLLPSLICGKGTALYARLLEQGLINERFDTDYFSGPGFGVWLFAGESADPDRVAQAIVEEIRRQQAEGIDPEELEPVRRAAYGRLISSLEDSSACGETVLADLLDGIAPLSELDAIADITAQALTEQLRSRIPAAEHTLSVIVPKTADVG